MTLPNYHPLRPEQLGGQSELIDSIAAGLIPEDVPGALGLRAIATEAIHRYVSQLEFGTFKPVFEPGERVEYPEWHGHPARSATVVEIDAEPKIHLYLRVRFDDGEERQINPDVMRRIRS